MTKTCSKCKTEQNTDQFFKDKRRTDRLTCWCRNCTRVSQNQRRSTPSGRLHHRQQNWNFHRIVNESSAPFTVNDYNRHFQIQGGRCKICGIHQLDLDICLVVDHNHQTHQFRGLLCKLCNHVLGLAKDDPIRLQRAADYLNKDI